MARSRAWIEALQVLGDLGLRPTIEDGVIYVQTPGSFRLDNLEQVQQKLRRPGRPADHLAGRQHRPIHGSNPRRHPSLADGCGRAFHGLEFRPLALALKILSCVRLLIELK